MIKWLRKFARSQHWNGGGGWRDWLTAWFGGSAVMAFQLHRPDLGWTWIVTSVVCLVGADFVDLVRAIARKVVHR